MTKDENNIFFEKSTNTNIDEILLNVRNFCSLLVKDYIVKTKREKTYVSIELEIYDDGAIGIYIWDKSIKHLIKSFMLDEYYKLGQSIRIE